MLTLHVRNACSWQTLLFTFVLFAIVTLPAPSQAQLDFGDASEVPYPTLLLNNGARPTIVAGVSMGALVACLSQGEPAAPPCGLPLGRLTS